MISQKEAVSDSGMTGHFLEIDSPHVDKTITKNGIFVRLLDGNMIKLSHTALLKWSILPDNAQQAHMFKELKKLISISQSCDISYLAIFNADMVYIIKIKKPYYWVNVTQTDFM